MPPYNSTRDVSEQRTDEALQRLRKLSQLLDNAIAIPGLGYRIGIDPLIGLLPGGGDMVAGLISIYVVIEAARLKVPAATLGRMGLNILIEVIIGTLPMIGDLFDVVWKANARNVLLLEHHLRAPRPSRRIDQVFAIALVIVLLAIVLGAAALSLMFVRLVLQM